MKGVILEGNEILYYLESKRKEGAGKEVKDGKGGRSLLQKQWRGSSVNGTNTSTPMTYVGNF